MVYGGSIKRDVNDQFKCVTENRMREKYDDSLEEWWSMKKDNLIVELENDAGVDDQDIAKSIKQMHCHPGSYILGHSDRLMINVI